MYLVAIMDWYSRYVLAWEISNTLDGDSVLRHYRGHSWCLTLRYSRAYNLRAVKFAGRLKEAGIQINMDGRWRVFDNIFIERLWRTVKYELGYIHSYETVREARESLAGYCI